MTLEELTTMIATVGFPIVMCLLMWYDNRNRTQKLIDMVENLKDTNSQMIGTLTALINSK